ncbi:hypothetical protein NUW54_g1111 [Trametes sanguinea]|uniref:Uncharacterized protein n=1 Tax=Trametes sanguinea TaxID=158606 RepID=A0ACC1Q7V8_9APHY|nr:hypothetical protein NUW54_g1111 [Trametes sanguinea]
MDTRLPSQQRLNWSHRAPTAARDDSTTTAHGIVLYDGQWHGPERYNCGREMMVHSGFLWTRGVEPHNLPNADRT